MKLTLSLAEVRTLVAKTLNLPAEVLIEITEFDSADKEYAFGIRQSMNQFMIDGKNSTVEPQRKIPAIKHLRTIVPGLGLCDAKWLVENWRQVDLFILSYSRFPILRGSGYNDYRLE